MLRVSASVAAIVYCLVLVGCSQKAGPAVASDQLTAEKYLWTTMKSPTTGRCYEVATRSETSGYSGYGYMGMSEIPCTEMK